MQVRAEMAVERAVCPYHGSEEITGCSHMMLHLACSCSIPAERSYRMFTRTEHSPDLKTLRAKSNPVTGGQFDEADCICGDNTEVWIRLWPNGEWKKNRVNP
jgi:hypothetical protein